MSSKNPLQNQPKTHQTLFHTLGRSITIVWAKTAPHLEPPSSLYLFICGHPEKRNRSLTLASSTSRRRTTSARASGRIAARHVTVSLSPPAARRSPSPAPAARARAARRARLPPAGPPPRPASGDPPTPPPLQLLPSPPSAVAGAAPPSPAGAAPPRGRIRLLPASPSLSGHLRRLRRGSPANLVNRADPG